MTLSPTTLWKRMHEQDLLRRDSTQAKNKAKRTIGGQRLYVIDIDAGLLYVSVTGTSGTDEDLPL
jgi:hypothetical protein